MHVSKVENHVCKAKFTSDTPIEVMPPDAPSTNEYRIADAVMMAKGLHAIAPLNTVRWKRTGDPSGNVYDLKIDAQDGREWKQTTDVGPVSPGVKFDVKDHYWFLEEFSFLQKLRLCMTFLSRQYGLSDMKIDFEVQNAPI